MKVVVHDKSPERGPQAFEHRSVCAHICKYVIGYCHHSPSFHSERPKSSVAKGTTPFLIWRMSSSNSKIAWLSSTHGSTPGHMVSSSNRLLSQFSTRRQSAMTGIRQYIDGGIWSCSSSSIIQEAQDVVGTKMLQSGIRHLIESHTCKSTSTLHVSGVTIPPPRRAVDRCECPRAEKALTPYLVSQIWSSRMRFIRADMKVSAVVLRAASCINYKEMVFGQVAGCHHINTTLNRSIG
ncbi:predicted protein [Histoplasma capsulatum H143]|uniref:Uncharacterized protein n=1 Tax=Ajellomyces capsulatus (strain H143) TaxID=544712 RepID=C6HNZ4_AJECH|nr:predicted protein [Histoplasma capsulatum H143]